MKKKILDYGQWKKKRSPSGPYIPRFIWHELELLAKHSTPLHISFRGFENFINLSLKPNYFKKPKLCNQVPSLSLSRLRTFTLKKIKVGWVLWCIKHQTIASCCEDCCESMHNWLLSEVWNIKSPNLSIFSTEKIPRNSGSPNGPRPGFFSRGSWVINLLINAC